MLKTFRRLFITGFLVLLPAMVTLYVIYFMFNMIDSFISSLLISLGFGQTIPGLGFLLTILVILAVGLIATNVFGKRCLNFLEASFARLPFVKPIYVSARQIIDAFSAQRHQLFQSVAMLQYPRIGLYAIGFITAQGAGEVQEKTQQEVVSFFIPTTPNPTSGVLLLVPRTDLIGLDMSVEEALKMIISGGVITPDWSQDKNKLKG